MSNVRNWVPMMYVTFYGIMRDIAKEHGYALTVHGSCVRDFDVVLIPWIDHPRPVIDVLTAWCDSVIGAIKTDGLPYYSIAQKPHGRVSYLIQVGGGGYIDVSVIPTSEDRAKQQHLTNGYMVRLFHKLSQIANKIKNYRGSQLHIA